MHTYVMLQDNGPANEEHKQIVVVDSETPQGVRHINYLIADGYTPVGTAKSELSSRQLTEGISRKYRIKAADFLETLDDIKRAIYKVKEKNGYY